MKSQNVSRKDLSTILLGNQTISKVEAKEVYMGEGQKAAYHSHPCNVVGYVVSGSVLYQEEGKEAVILNKREVFFEPKNKRIVHFDNASETEPLVFIAYYLLEGDESLIEFPDR
jgi:quercetin dioxygenase-like cupin family protein